MLINEKLIDKYNVAVPRYTSYPPANHFSNEFSETDYHTLLKKSNQEEPQHVGIYIHIPFCKQICFYCGCNAQRFNNANSVEDYINALKHEIELVLPYINKNRKLSQIHYGGGTPNAIEAKYLKEINQIFFDHFSLIKDAEIAIECNPALLNTHYLDQLFEAGFNRFSFGIQDFDRNILAAVNRKPSAIPVKALLSYVRERNPQATVNLDFMYGLPGQTVESFAATIDQAVEVRPDRLVTFSYAHVPWMKKHQKVLETKGLPGPQEKMAMFLKAYEKMLAAGYQAIGLDHYALPDDELSTALNQRQLHRNFQGYCTRRTTGQVYAFGVSGITQLGGGFSQTVKDIPTYQNMLSSDGLPVEKGIILQPDQKVIKEVIVELMCNKYLNWAAISQRLNLPEEQVKSIVGYNPDTLIEFVDDGLLTFTKAELQVTETGSLFIRNIAATFDPAYKQTAATYSKSV